MCAGVGPLQWVFVGELLPPEYKVLAGLATGLTVIAVFVLVKTFHLLLLVAGPHGTFWLFAAVAITANIFLYYLMPETKGKSLLEIKERILTNEEATNKI